jgi:hypothetical protein
MVTTNKVFYFLLLLFLNALSTFAQKNTISGHISDSQTGEKIINAVIYQEGTKNYTYSNNFGYYILAINNIDSVVINVSNIGYTEIRKIVPFQTIVDVDFELISDNQIKEITISGRIPIQDKIETGNIDLKINDIKQLPLIAGESDVMKVFHLMPGVQSGSEGSSALYVRGGSPDENLILLDDVPLYYVNHLGGFISVFNSDAIKNVTMIKGGFPARYGSRLSSVVDVRMKEGNMKEFHGNIGIGLTSSKFNLEGPIKKDKSSFIISGRAFLLGLLAQPLSRLVTNAMVGYNFYDLNAKMNYIINQKNKLYFSFYKGDDNVMVRFKQGDINKIKANNTTRWGNTLVAGRWNKVYSSGLFSNATISYTKYRYGSSIDYTDNAEDQTYHYEFETMVNDLSVLSDFEYTASKSIKFRFGSKSILHHFKPGFSYYQYNKSDEFDTDTAYGYSSVNAVENALYSEGEFKAGKFFSGNIGFHASHYYVDNHAFFSPEPRIIAVFKPIKYFSIKLSYARMQQRVHLLTSNTVSLPMDVWVPATSDLMPSNSNQYALGFYSSLFKGNYEFSIESYYKTSDHLIAYKEGATYRSVSKNWIDKLETEGIGTSYGTEVLIQKKTGNLTGWIGYTFAKTERKFANLNNGNAFPFKYDRRHDISIVVLYKLNNHINLSMNWVYGSGYPYTLPIAKYEGVNNGTTNLNSYYLPDIWYNENVLIYADRNSYRMRPYHRLDLGINLTKQKKYGNRTWSFSIYNVYNRQNPYYYYTKAVGSEMKLYQQSLFPIIPSVSYSYSF